MNLHDIIPKRLTALVWFYITGGNGQLIGRQDMHHLFEIERGTPPPAEQNAQPWRHDPRNYWRPWGTSPYRNNTRQLVLCQLRVVRTQARLMQPNRVWGVQLDLQCPECTRIAGERGLYTEYSQTLITNDPWNTIPQHNRATTPDPLTGL